MNDFEKRTKEIIGRVEKKGQEILENFKLANVGLDRLKVAMEERLGGFAVMRETLEGAKTFIEYAKHHLEPGEVDPDLAAEQYPRQKDADTEIKRIEKALSSNSAREFWERVRKLEKLLNSLPNRHSNDCHSMMEEGADCDCYFRYKKELDRKEKKNETD